MTSENTQLKDDRPTTTSSVATASDMDVGSMKMAKVGDRRVAVVRTASGFHALDNACPHQGYGLVTGSLDGELLTCQWHNWKFCVTDGSCVVGEESVEVHPVEIVDGEVMVSVTERTNDEKLAALWPSLEAGLAKDYRGQIARDVARLLDAGADPVDIVWHAIRYGSPRGEWGVGHEMAAAADCLAMVDQYEGLERTLPITQALAGISEEMRDRPVRHVEGTTGVMDFATAVESEDLEAATGALTQALSNGVPMEVVRDWFVETVGAHHLSYGHGAIYVQKAFEVIERAGWERAGDLLPHLLTSIVYGTREDTLPYMRKAIKAIETVDLDALVSAGAQRDPEWNNEALRSHLLNSSEAPIVEAVAAVLDGSGIEGLLDAVSLAVSERLLRYDVSYEDDVSDPFGWLDITHGLTYARAARWAWRHHPGQASARLAMYTVFLCHDTGRLERRSDVQQMNLPTPRVGDVEAAIASANVDDAVAFALGGDIEETSQALARASLSDGSASFIVVAHQVKMAKAAAEEATVTGSTLPLAATARFAAGPRRERFVSRNVAEAVGFVLTGQPPLR